ncbi:MAG: hypothetical protein MUC62_01325 [Candidatus Thermoplasmatota archaeon]|jgi:type II secretory pathway component PulM|nr:hypothetical protein [Candidatus Thermoplasmatota archaeon]
MRKTRERFVLLGAVAFAISLMLLLVAFKEPVEREVESGKDIRWYRDNVK